MANTRLILWFAFAAILYLNYEAWMHDYGPTPPSAATAPAAVPAAGSSSSLGESVPSAKPAPAAPAPDGTAGSTSNATPGSAAAPAAQHTDLAAAPAQHEIPRVHVITDVLDVWISLKGGEIDGAELLQYPLHKDTPNVPVKLESTAPDALYLLQSGLLGAAGEASPNHLATLTAAELSYVLPAGANELRVPLTWTDGQGLSVTKTFVFTRGCYRIDLDYEVDNAGAAPRSLASYARILRTWEHASRSYFDVETYSFKGPAVYDGAKARDLKVEDAADSKFSQIITNGWLASLQHHFVSAIVPAANQPYSYSLEVQGHRYLIGATGPFKQVAAGAKTEFKETLFIGPKLQQQLAATGPKLERTADYGLLTVIAQPLFTTLTLSTG